MTAANDDFTRARAAFLARAGELSQKERDHARLSFLDELRRSPLFTPTAKLVGWEITQCVDETLGYAWPKGETLAEWLNIDERTVVRAVEELERVRAIVVERMRRRLNHYLVPYFWVLGDKLSFQQTVCPAVGKAKMSPGGDTDAPRKGDKDASQTPFNPYSSPESRGYRGRDAGSALAAQLATELSRTARINVLQLSERQRRHEIAEVQSWLDAGWDPDVIRTSAIDRADIRRLLFSDVILSASHRPNALRSR